MRYFSESEFDSPDEPGSGRHMKPGTLKALDSARARTGKPYVITSGYRTPEHNDKVGGVKDSAHVRGYAADISIKDWTEADVVRLIADLSAVGFRRIGRANTFVHVDNDPDKPTPAYWDYMDSPEHKA
jgi:zinc D-Ala-D-Ala carboxypeptidase